MPRTPGLSRSDLRRLARQAGTTPARILRAVLRDGFDYTEWFVRRVSEGDADLKARRVVSTTGHLIRSRAVLPVERYTAKRVREFDRAEAALGKALHRMKRTR